MLLNFKVSNYKSFKEQVVLSMIPAPKQKDLSYSILTREINKKTHKVLSTSVIYGPNASGKTNIIGALETLVSIIKRGHIRNTEKINSYNTAMHRLELIPNNREKTVKPVTFEFEFVVDNEHFTYYLEIEIGKFLELDFSRKILKETLLLNDEILFNRNHNNITFNEILNPKSSKKTDNQVILNIIAQSMANDELFLSNGFKNILSKEYAQIIFSFIENKLKIIYRADQLNVTRSIPAKSRFIKDATLTRIAKEFGACAGDSVGYFKRDKQDEPDLVTIVDLNDEHFVLNSEFIESYGTIRFLNIFPVVYETINNGGILVVDEFDASIHPMVLIEIVNIFHNNEINTNGAQLIFNTHNPVFLNNAVLRRDEIKFVEYQKNKASSIIYALSDFGTSGDKAVRSTNDYMKDYFMDKYGAITEIDLTPYFVGNNDETDK